MSERKFYFCAEGELGLMFLKEVPPNYKIDHVMQHCWTENKEEATAFASVKEASVWFRRLEPLDGITFCVVRFELEPAVCTRCKKELAETKLCISCAIDMPDTVFA